MLSNSSPASEAEMAQARDNDPDENVEPANSFESETENEDNDNDDLGLDADGDPSPNAYESESAAPMREQDRQEVRDRLGGRAQWDSANETGDPTGNEVENGPEVDPNDPNLSATLAEAGAEERKDALGMTDIEPFLDDPEAETEEDE
jgi:hypothetical protein